MKTEQKGHRVQCDTPNREAKKPATVSSAFAEDSTSMDWLEQPQIDSRPEARKLDFPFTDTGNAELLVRLFGDKVRYCPTLGWLVWDGARWRRDEIGMMSQIAKATARYRFATAVRMPEHELREKAKKH